MHATRGYPSGNAPIVIPAVAGSGQELRAVTDTPAMIRDFLRTLPYTGSAAGKQASRQRTG